MQSKISNSHLETKKIGEEFGKNLKKGYVICLYGNLGAGKTTFVQGMAKGLGIERRIISPTFVILRSYKIKNQKSKVKIASQNLKVFYHIDLYRIENEKEIEGLGLEEILNDKNSIVAIEWPEKLGSKLPKIRTDIYFENIDRDVRQIIWK